ncbi:class I SAM-dependent methyltransferase [Microlunatus sp. Gsoil 973]|uniref:class I SAM-dependent methyltransferase n=1 Tax=Microlunatus sp. Gsoil 973 TaxID=2672569 RepID=UPI001E316772|nr:class I SAM-dependent methyltransferase [Microlunatus sp. Gsoil 973]
MSRTDNQEPMIMADSAARIRFVDSPETEHRPFLPGMGKAWLMPLYDPCTRLLGIARFRAQLIKYAQIEAGQKVLDVGCGSGDLLLALAAAVPGAELTGLDPDGVALGRAARKAAAAGAGVTLIRGYADELPLEDASLDHVVSTLAIHHLDAESQARFAAEARRVLSPGGKVTILDFGGPSGDHAHGPLGHLSALLDAAMRRSPQVQANLDDGLPDLLRRNGFDDAAEVAHHQAFFGSLTIVRATR